MRRNALVVLFVLLFILAIGFVWYSLQRTSADVEIDAVTEQVQLMPWRDTTNIEWFLRKVEVRAGGERKALDSVILRTKGYVEIVVQRRGLGTPVIYVDARGDDSSARVQLINPAAPETTFIRGARIELTSLGGTSSGGDEVILRFRSGATLGTPVGQSASGSFSHFLVGGRIDVLVHAIFSQDQFVASTVRLGPADFVSTREMTAESDGKDKGDSTSDAAGAIVIGNEAGLRFRALFTSRVVHVLRADGKQITESPRVFATILGDPVLRFLAASLGLLAIFFPILPSPVWKNAAGADSEKHAKQGAMVSTPHQVNLQSAPVEVDRTSVATHPNPPLAGPPELVEGKSDAPA